MKRGRASGRPEWSAWKYRGADGVLGPRPSASRLKAASATRDAASDDAIRFVALGMISWDRPVVARRLARLHAATAASFRYFAQVQSATEIIQRTDGLHDCWSGDSSQFELDAAGVRLPEEWAPNEAFQLRPMSGGRHRLGGLPPRGFVMPALGKRVHAFQHLLTIDGRDPAFRWLQVPRLTVIYPTLASGGDLRLDMSVPLKPRVMNAPRLYWRDDEPTAEPIVYRSKALGVARTLAIPRSGGGGDDSRVLCGIPMWQQEPAWPRCPRTGEDMRFVCQVESSRSVPMQAPPKSVDRHWRFLLLGDMGTLYVFYHPGSRVLHLTLQF